ncbi:MAG: cytochrome c oxidase assembly protein [Acidobacteriota bacterium]|nr:cytochrome c oxidase assembly protein [Acidobacteriota bacterium]
MGLTPLDFFTKARFGALDAAVLVVGAAWYLWSVRSLRRRNRSWPGYRSACFAAAWATLAVAEFSGLTTFGRRNFTAYGTIYILVGLVAPALLAASAPVTLALLSAGDGHPARWLESRTARIVAGPMSVWVLFTTSVFVVFFAGVVPSTIGGGWGAQGLHLWWLIAGWLFYWPVLAVDPVPWRMSYLPRILYLLLVFPVFAIMGMGLESQTSRIASSVTPASLHLGGAVVWVAGETVALAGVLWVFATWLRADERRARAQEVDNEHVAARQMAVWRASREAAARAASQ